MKYVHVLVSPCPQPPPPLSSKGLISCLKMFVLKRSKFISFKMNLTSELAAP